MTKRKANLEVDSLPNGHSEDTSDPWSVKHKKKKNKNKETVAEENEEQAILKIEDEEIDDVEKDEWDLCDKATLLSNLEKELPKNDITIKYSTSLEKINWENVKFNNYSADECKTNAVKLIEHLRKFRTLGEMIVDAKDCLTNPSPLNFSDIRNMHPDMPKKPMTPFLRFFQKKRLKYQEANPEFSLGQLTKLASTKFAALSEKKKQKYKNTYLNEMTEYRENMSLFKKEHPDLFPSPSRQRNVAQKQLEGPAKPQTPFQLYFASKSKKYDDEDKKALNDRIREQWNNLSENKRIKWIKKSIRSENRYREELEEYIKENPDFVPGKFKSVLNKSEVTLKEKFDGKPLKPPASGYMQYSKLMLSEVKDVPTKEKMVIIAKRWKEMSDEERNNYNNMAQKNMDKYHAKYELYLQQLPEEERQRIESQSKPTKLTQKKAKAIKSESDLLDNTAKMAYQMEELINMKGKYPTKSHGELMQLVNQQWLSMDSGQKDKYLQMAESIKDYMPNSVKSPTKKKAKDDALIELENQGIKRPAKNGFTLYSQDILCKNTNLPPTKRMQFAAKEWKNETEAVRQKYCKDAKELNEQFNKTLTKFKLTGKIDNTNNNSAKKSLAGKSNKEKEQSQKKNVSKFLYDSGSDSDD